MSPFLSLSRPALDALVYALSAERISFPVHSVMLDSYIPPSLQQPVSAELNRLRQGGMSLALMVYTLKLLIEEKKATQAQQDRISLVWTGTECPGSESRDTHIVVKELFSTAMHSVLISSFALDKGSKGKELFQPLAERMDANPHLNVRMFLNVQRKFKDATPTTMLLRQFAEDFRNQIWPGQRLPEVFYDPRSLSTDPGPKACLHAKCIVVDEARLFVTSANFTEAAHERNIEAGIMIADPVAARVLRSQFETLVVRGVLSQIPGL
jgi:PLD-like domain